MHKYLAFALSALLVLASCGGGGGLTTSGGGGITGPGPNVTTLNVEVGPAPLGLVNTPFITITVCQPGSAANCQTIDNIEVDTGSVGLRLIASVLNPALLAALPQQLLGATTTPVVECAQFADGYAWGPVVSADLTISSEKASGIPVQVIGSPSFTQIPASCSTPVPNEEDSVATFGANGIIGVGVFQQDCGGACASGVIAGTYYGCPTNGSACTSITEPTNLQVSNPVASFATDNNGVIVELPSVAAGGAPRATGALVFGIGTQSNNALGSATILATDPGSGTINVTFGGVAYPLSVIDTGSNAFYFTDSSLSVCAQGTSGAGFYCTNGNISATITTNNNTELGASFTIADAATMFNADPGAAVYPQLAGPLGGMLTQTFDLGLPYFLGRNVFTAIENTSAAGVQGPWVAY